LPTTMDGVWSLWSDAYQSARGRAPVGAKANKSAATDLAAMVERSEITVDELV